MTTTILSLLVLDLWIVPTAESAPVPWDGNGHSYDFIPGVMTWHDARDAAASMSFEGVSGHLATITSAPENAFLLATFQTGLFDQFAWLGGHEPGDDGHWRWATGPEAGEVFSIFSTPTAPFDYANWGGIEPNDHKPEEDFLMFNIGTSVSGIAPGQWADGAATPSGWDPVIGFLVEFEAVTTVPEAGSIGLVPVLGLLAWWWSRPTQGQSGKP